MSLSASDAADRVEQLIKLTERLTERLEGELAALGTRKPHEAAPTDPETARLRIGGRMDPSLIASAPAARVETLRRVTESFEALVSRHALALNAARTLTEGLVHAIASEVARQRTPAAGYGPKAKSNAPDTSALTLNRRA